VPSNREYTGMESIGYVDAEWHRTLSGGKPTFPTCNLTDLSRTSCDLLPYTDWPASKTDCPASKLLILDTLAGALVHSRSFKS
jgi:hypothetical protein